MRIEIKVNGINKVFDILPDEYLVDTLRNNGYTSVKKGCDTGICGCCTVHMDGKAILSCVMLSARAAGHEITTIEGVSEKARKVDEGVEQCGYCSTGLIMNILYMEKVVKEPTDEEILHYLNGNLCRCTGYIGQLRAIKKYLEAKNNENCK